MIETKRLNLIPLTISQLKLWTDDLGILEKELNVKYRAEPTDGFFGDIIRGQAIKAEKDAENYIYYSFWWIVRKDDRVAMGSCGFKNIPDENGEVEIGYGLAKKEYEGRGFMAEAIKALCRWALAQKDVKRIIAETDKGNLKSENVLKRVGFAAYKHKHDDNGATWWRL